jgi:hypothetical protein
MNTFWANERIEEESLSGCHPKKVEHDGYRRQELTSFEKEERGIGVSREGR